jgi:serine/threonine-protein kinase RsbW
MAGTNVSFRLKNTLNELDRLYRELETFADSIGLSKKLLFQINLALDELFTNIVSYGFPDNRLHWVTITLLHSNNTVTIRVEDNGKPFDPASTDVPETQADLKNCRVGGLGLRLVRQMMDDMAYKRSGRKNIITLTKHLGDC